VIVFHQVCVINLKFNGILLIFSEYRNVISKSHGISSVVLSMVMLDSNIYELPVQGKVCCKGRQ